jgi:8-oxo-dGTP pyrophosphatase MutT (NUDIX family)
MSGFEKTGEDVVWEGRLATVRVERFRHSDGEEVTRELVAHPGAVVIVAHDEARVWLVRQPREVVGDAALLELPAGKLDAGEPPLETAKRELAEEVGRAAESWESLGWFYTSPGFTDERIEVFLATGLSEASAESEENERIETDAWPLERLDDAIGQCHDAKSLVGLMWLRARLAG